VPPCTSTARLVLPAPNGVCDGAREQSGSGSSCLAGEEDGPWTSLYMRNFTVVENFIRAVEGFRSNDEK